MQTRLRPAQTRALALGELTVAWTRWTAEDDHLIYVLIALLELAPALLLRRPSCV